MWSTAPSRKARRRKAPATSGAVVLRLFVGLGNPGPRYEGTRHNVGFEAVDRILESGGGRWSGASADSVTAETKLEGHRLTLLKPLTYMNLSGDPVARSARELSIVPEEILVCYDDVALPLGTLRLRERGSDGGHRGMRSILEELGSLDVPRLRIGIAPEAPPPQGLVDFVLERFRPDERKGVDEALERVVLATRAILKDGMAKAQSLYNAPAGLARRQPGRETGP